MKTTVTSLPDNQIRVEVEVSEDELSPALERAAREIGRTVKLKGFRPGRIPRKVLERHVGRQALLDEAVPTAVPGFLADAVAAEEIDWVGRPTVEDVAGGVDGPLSFAATLDLRPEVSVGDVSDIVVRLDGPVEPTEEEITAEVDAVRARYATLETVQRGAAEGDHVLINLDAHRNTETIDELTRNDLLYEVGSANLVEELDAELLGATAGSILKFNAALPEFAPFHPGEEVTFGVLVKEVKQRVLPELTDAWVDENSEFDTVEEMRAELVGHLGAAKLDHMRRMAQDNAVDALVERADVAVPASVVDLEVDARVNDLARQLDGQNIEFGQYLDATGQDLDSLREQMRPQAEKARAAEFVLSAYAEEAGIELSETDLDRLVTVLAAQSGRHPEQARKELQRSGRIAVLEDSFRRQRALADLMEKVSVVDDSGDPVDLSYPEPDADVAVAEATEDSAADAGDEESQSRAAESAGGEAASGDETPTSDPDTQDGEAVPAERG